MLQNDAMVVRLSVGQWTARKFDKQATQHVAAEYSVKADVGRYNKALLAKEAIQSITRVVSNVRMFHYTNTLPWDDGGGRLLPAKNFMTYTSQIRGFKEEFAKAVRDFVDNYDTYRDQAETALGGLFNAGDYPSMAEVAYKFRFEVDFEPVSTAADFRVTLQTDEVEAIKKDIEAKNKDRLKEATYDLFERLNDAVSKLADKLAEEDAIFRDSLVENVVELTELLPKLNVTNDSKLNDLLKVTMQKICSLNPDTLRKEPEVRAKAVDDAKKILDRMAGYLGK
jgi:hypothetical protein